jgi:hypothetical protein
MNIYTYTYIFRWKEAPFNNNNNNNNWQNSPSSVIAFLRRYCQICLELDHPVFTSLDFATSFFIEQDRQPNIQPPDVDDQVSVFMSSSDGVAQLYPQATGSLSTTRRATVGVF